MSQGLGVPKGRERDGGTSGRSSSQITHNIYRLAAVLYRHGLQRPKLITVVTSNKEHWSQITISNIIIIKKFEILPSVTKLPTYDTGLQANAVGKIAPINLLNTELHKPSICKKCNV